MVLPSTIDGTIVAVIVPVPLLLLGILAPPAPVDDNDDGDSAREIRDIQYIFTENEIRDMLKAKVC